MPFTVPGTGDTVVNKTLKKKLFLSHGAYILLGETDNKQDR